MSRLHQVLSKYDDPLSHYANYLSIMTLQPHNLCIKWENSQYSLFMRVLKGKYLCGRLSGPSWISKTLWSERNDGVGDDGINDDKVLSIMILYFMKKNIKKVIIRNLMQK